MGQLLIAEITIWGLLINKVYLSLGEGQEKIQYTSFTTLGLVWKVYFLIEHKETENKTKNIKKWGCLVITQGALKLYI